MISSATLTMGDAFFFGRPLFLRITIKKTSKKEPANAEDAATALAGDEGVEICVNIIRLRKS